MRGESVLFSSARTAVSRDRGSTDQWFTPSSFYDLLDGEFGFTLDPCACERSARTAYFDEEADGLAQDWGDEVCFVNFPYSQSKAWSEKCLSAASAGATVVVLCAARTDTQWWQAMASSADEVRFVKGRLWFENANGSPRKGGVQSAAFPSSVIVLRPGLERHRIKMTFWDLPLEQRR